MLRISKIADYSVVTLLELSAAGDALLTTRAVSERTQIPQTTVAKSLKALHKAGLVRSHRGLCGGYALATTPDNITLKDIIEAIDGPISLTTCSVPSSIHCDTHTTCRAGPHWPAINQAVAASLDGILLADLKHSPATPKGLEGRPETKPKPEVANVEHRS